MELDQLLAEMDEARMEDKTSIFIIDNLQVLSYLSTVVAFVLLCSNVFSL